HPRRAGLPDALQPDLATSEWLHGGTGPHLAGDRRQVPDPPDAGWGGDLRGADRAGRAGSGLGPRLRRSDYSSISTPASRSSWSARSASPGWASIARVAPVCSTTSNPAVRASSAVALTQ